MDDSGEKVYEFNSLGFRGEEYKPDAKFHIFVFGVSSTFVTGLNWEEGFTTIFRDMLARNKGWAPEEVNLMNFSVGVRSTDFCVRNMLRQCETEKPDLLIMELGNMPRIEFITKGGEGIPIIIGGPQTEKSLEFYEFYEDEVGFANIAKNILLVQYFCQANNIDYLIINNKSVYFDRFKQNAACMDFINVIDHDHILDLCDFKKVDFAADVKYEHDEEGKLMGYVAHNGPKTNEIIAKHLFLLYRDIYR
jgi:hypothetical protein